MNTDKSPQEMVESCITAMQAVHETEDSWRGVVKGGDPDNFCTKNEIFKIRQQALFLSMAYQLALQNINQWTWYNCCKETCSRLNDLGIQQATLYRTVEEAQMLPPPKCLCPVWEATAAATVENISQCKRTDCCVWRQKLNIPNNRSHA
jgi:hypothetical protein